MTDETYIGIQQELREAIKGTLWEGHVFFVGGCVRDELMNATASSEEYLERHDIDIAVDTVNGGIRFARWLEKRHLTARGKSIQTFPHFGTAKVRLRAYPGEIIDCVQTRKDRYVYESHPQPEKNFGTVVEDAIRRDLTINSLFLNISTGELLDPTGLGVHDIENHIIRCPNDPDVTLTDNPMHVLRCIRFAVRYGWELQPDMMEHLKRNAQILREARDRQLAKEVSTILSLEGRDRALSLIDEIGATEYIRKAEEYIRLMKETGISIEEPWFQHSRHHKKNNKWKHRRPKKDSNGDSRKSSKGKPKKSSTGKPHLPASSHPS